jgi:hypothetical protein
MKFMINWRIHDESRHNALKTFSQLTLQEELGDYADKINVIGRWHDLVGFTGVAIVETEDINAINSWLLKWNHIVDASATPVLDDEETRETGRAIG